nr:DnaJ C-terminal domain-containing protein [Streptomyces sp. YIM 132580]
MVTLSLPLEQTALGTTMEIQTDTKEVCPTCSGSGWHVTATSCPHCEGSGEGAQNRSHDPNRNGRLCTQCDGRGMRGSCCAECEGHGRVPNRRTLIVKIPPGIVHGTRIQLAGEGDAGFGGGPAADLYAEIHEDAHPTLERRGDDLHCTVTVPQSLAVAGGSAQVETLEGARTVGIPAGTRRGQTMRLTGLGVPHLFADGRGDFLIHIETEKTTAGP